MWLTMRGFQSSGQGPDKVEDVMTKGRIYSARVDTPIDEGALHASKTCLYRPHPVLWELPAALPRNGVVSSS